MRIAFLTGYFVVVAFCIGAPNAEAARVKGKANPKAQVTLKKKEAADNANAPKRTTLKGSLIKAKRQQAKQDKTWKNTTMELKKVLSDRGLMKSLAAKQEVIILDTRSGEGYRGRVIAEGSAFKATLDPFSEYSMSVNTKVQWQEQLIIGPKGLQVRSSERVAKPSKKAMTQLASKVHKIMAEGKAGTKLPSGNLPLGKFGKFRITDIGKARINLIGFGERIQSSDWEGLTTKRIEARVSDWVNRTYN